MSKETQTGGIGCGTALFLIFLVLKLTNLIDWNWWWVTAPIWIPISILLVVLILVMLFSGK